MRLGAEELDDASVGVFDGGAWQRANAEEAALAFDEGDDAGLAAAVDSIALPVAKARPTLDDSGMTGKEVARQTLARWKLAARVQASEALTTGGAMMLEVPAPPASGAWAAEWSQGERRE